MGKVRAFVLGTLSMVLFPGPLLGLPQGFVLETIASGFRKPVDAVLTPDAFQRFRVPLNTAAVVELAGPVQNVDGVIHVSVRELKAVVPRATLPGAHDYR